MVFAPSSTGWRPTATDEAEVIRRLKFVGPAGAREFLWLIGAVDDDGV